jgi:hypothetical protein
MCNTQLDHLKHDMSNIEGYDELRQLKEQELQTVGGSC